MARRHTLLEPTACIIRYAFLNFQSFCSFLDILFLSKKLVKDSIFATFKMLSHIKTSSCDAHSFFNRFFNLKISSSEIFTNMCLYSSFHFSSGTKSGFKIGIVFFLNNKIYSFNFGRRLSACAILTPDASDILTAIQFTKLCLPKISSIKIFRYACSLSSICTKMHPSSDKRFFKISSLAFISDSQVECSILSS